MSSCVKLAPGLPSRDSCRDPVAKARRSGPRKRMPRRGYESGCRAETRDPLLASSLRTPASRVPMQVDGVKYGQSTALLRYAGKLSKIYPEDPLMALKVWP